MCSRCDGFSEKIRIVHPYEYLNIVEQLKVILSEGTLKIIQGNCDFYTLQKGQLWPDDVLYHVFECTSCDRKFELSVETYHGSGGAWDVVNL